MDQNSLHFIKRFYIYQKERFNFLSHGILISAFTFSAISYSRLCREAIGFITLKSFLIAIFTTISTFFLLRIFDEFKDAEDDAKFRKNLPVPRGLISLKELKYIGILTATIQIGVLVAFRNQLLPFYFMVMSYLLLMGKEFFVAEWLKKRQIIYVVSHMLIIPLVDVFASGFDWFLEGENAPTGLIFFFAVSFMNGIVLEFGRKIRAPHKEEVGVVTYSALYGPVKATIYWLAIIISTLFLSMAASTYANHPSWIYLSLTIVLILCSIPAFVFLKYKSEKSAKWIEYAAGLWTIAMYLLLGGAPMIGRFFQ